MSRGAQGAMGSRATDQPIVEAAMILGLTQLGIATMSLGMLPPDGLKIDAVIGTTVPTLSAARHLPLDDAWTPGDGAQAEAVGIAGSVGDEICRIVLTSGTTGEPKAVALTHRQVAARTARFQYLFGSRFPSLSRIYMGLGLASSFGYYFLPHTLGRGGTLFFGGGRGVPDRAYRGRGGPCDAGRADRNRRRTGCAAAGKHARDRQGRQRIRGRPVREPPDRLGRGVSQRPFLPPAIWGR
jgi:AMP-binding enzyme